MIERLSIKSHVCVHILILVMIAMPFYITANQALKEEAHHLKSYFLSSSPHQQQYRLRRHNHDRRHLCQFPKSLLTSMDENEILHQIDTTNAYLENMFMEDGEDGNADGRLSTLPPVHMVEVNSKSKSESNEDSLSEVKDRKVRHRNKGHVNDQYSPEQNEDNRDRTKNKKNKRIKTRHRRKSDSNLNVEIANREHFQRSLQDRNISVQLRDWRGDIRRNFHFLGKTLTIDRYMISENKEGELSKYRCISDLTEDEDHKEIFGDGKQYTYVVEKEEYLQDQATPSRKFYICLMIISRSTDIIQFAFSYNNSQEHNRDLCNSPMFLDNWLYVDKLGIAKAKQDCPLKAGFEMKMFNSVGREALCDAYIRETRYESGCSYADSSHFSFYFRWPRCVPSAVNMKPTQELTCAASWHQSSFLYIVLRSPIYTKDTEISNNLIYKNKISGFHTDMLYKSLSVSGNEKFMTYMFRLPINSENTGKQKSFQAILYPNLVTIPGFEIQSTTYTDGVYVRMSSNQDERTALCEDDYEACTSINLPCGSLFKVTCPKTCGLCNADLNFNGSSFSDSSNLTSVDIPFFCKFQPFLNGNWMELNIQQNFSSVDNNVGSESLYFNGEYLERSLGVDSHRLKCVKWAKQSQKTPLPSSPVLPYFQVMTVGRHDNGCSPRYTCLKIFPLSQHSIAVSFSKAISWPLVISSQLENTENEHVIDCESAQKVTYDFYPKENFRLFTKLNHSHLLKTETEPSYHIPYIDLQSELNTSAKIVVFNKLLSLFNDNDSMNITFSDGFKCSGSLKFVTSDVDDELKLQLSNCTNEIENENLFEADSRLIFDQLQRRHIRHKYFLSNISAPHLKLLNSRKLKFIDSILMQKYGENVRSVATALRYDKNIGADTGIGNNLFVITAISSEFKRFFVPYCWLIRNVVMDGSMNLDNMPQPFNGSIFLFSGKGCVNAIEDYISSTDAEYLRHYKFFPPSHRPTKQDQLKFAEEDFANRSLAVMKFVSKTSKISLEMTTINEWTTGMESVTSQTIFEGLIPPDQTTVQDMPRNISTRITTLKSAEEFMAKIVARLILAMIDFLALIKSLFL